MKKILFISSTGEKANRLDGETIKSRLLRDYIKGIEGVELVDVDTDSWKKKIPYLVTKILNEYRKNDIIIISSSDVGAHLVLSFFHYIKNKKPVYYFVIGGQLAKRIESSNWNKDVYARINQMYVEANKLKQDLMEMGFTNVYLLNNFRKAEEFENKYEKTDHTKFVYFGRIIKEKGVEQAMQLVKRLNDEGIKCTLDLYGQCTEDYLPQVKKYLDKNIHFHGEIKPDNKHEYEELSKYDLFLFPTEYPGECLPGALIDCYIAGLGVIASEWTYAREYIEDEKNGRLFKYKDYEDMYEVTKRVIAEGKIQEYKARSLELSKQYLIENQLSQFEKEIKDENN